MPDYRLYCLRGAGRIRIAEWIEASDDAGAIAKMREEKRGVACEIWARQRLVATLDVKGEIIPFALRTKPTIAAVISAPLPNTLRLSAEMGPRIRR